MRLTADRISVLVEHGLNDNQARVYLALLEFPALNAGALATTADIPRNRLYEVLDELQGAGLVEIILGETRKYRALPLAAYLDRSVAELRARMQRIESQRADLDAAFQPPALTPTDELEVGKTRVVLSRRAVARELDRLMEKAEHSIMAVGSAGGWARLATHLEKTPAGVLERGAIELYLPRSASDGDGAERFPESWRKAVRYVDIPLRTLTLLVDEREMMLVHPIPDDEKPRVGHDFALLTDNRAFVRDHLALVRKSASADGA